MLVVLTAQVAAQPEPAPPQSATLFEEGRELAKQQKWAEACEKFQASLALDPAPGTKLNLGDCLENQGKVRAGWEMYQAAAADFERTNDARAKFAHERAAAAGAKLATVVIKVANPSREGLAIRIGEHAVEPGAELVERVDPGEVAVTASAPDRVPFTKTLTAYVGNPVVVEIPELAARETAEVPAGGGRRRSRVVVAIGIGATGGVALLGSGVLGLMARSKYHSAFDDGECFETPDGNLCTPSGKSEIDRAGSLADIATGFAIAGVALVAAGAIVYLTAPEERGVAISPVASSSTVGLAVGGRF